jgi:hypothetical protein
MLIDRIVQEIRHAALAVGLFVAFAIPSIDAQGTATIAGTATTKAGPGRPVRITIDQHVCGNELPDEEIVIDGHGRLANAVVTLVGVKSPAGASRAGVMNEKCRFSPRVQIVRPNAVITTSSKDPILHTTNAQIEGGRQLFNIAVAVPGININRPVNGAGLVRLSCNIHPWMRGWMLVSDDMATVTGMDGSFRLTEVPAGTFELRIWHESLRGAPQRVTVAAGQTATVNFNVQ